MMRTSEDSDFLTGQQLEFLYAIWGGEWHERKSIRIEKGLKKLIPSVMAERIIKPLEAMGIIEQEERPMKEGSRKMKKLVRIKKDGDEYRLHSLIAQSANDLALKYSRRKNPDKANFFLAIRDKSLKKLDELEEILKERFEKDAEDYWQQQFQMNDSEAWRKLIAAHKSVHDALRSGCKRCCAARGCHEDDCYPLKRPGVSFLIACRLNPSLVQEILRHEKEPG